MHGMRHHMTSCPHYTRADGLPASLAVPVGAAEPGVVKSLNGLPVAALRSGSDGS